MSRIYTPIVKPSSPIGQTIGFTRDLFEPSVCWNFMPVGVKFNGLRPIEGKEDIAIKQLLVKIKNLGLKANFSCPAPFLVKHLIDFNYLGYLDSACVPMWANISTKALQHILNRPGYRAIVIDQELRDFCSQSPYSNFLSPTYRTLLPNQPVP